MVQQVMRLVMGLFVCFRFLFDDRLTSVVCKNRKQWFSISGSAVDDMHPGIRFDDVRKFSNFEFESCILKWLLHRASGEVSQITATFCGRAVRVLCGQFIQCDILILDLRPVLCHQFARIVQ
jgi:hypothetical protein